MKPTDNLMKQHINQEVTVRKHSQKEACTSREDIYYKCSFKSSDVLFSISFSIWYELNIEKVLFYTKQENGETISCHPNDG